MKRWLIWAVASGATLVASGFALLNFWAAADLGYDTYPGGKSILAQWFYATVGLFAANAISGIFAIRAWLRSSKARRGSSVG